MVGVLATGEIWLMVPPSMRIEWTGKLGSRVMYDLADLDVWFASRGVHTTDTAPQLRGGK